MVPPASQRLLAFLALQAGATTRVYVAGMLWTDFSPDKANANLRTTLWRLSRAPWPLVDATPTHLRLAHGVTVDVHETEAIARRITSDGYRCEDDELERIVAAGDLLPDWYDDWTIIERERFRQTRLHALEVLSYTLTREGRHRQAIEVGLAAVAGEPLRESAHRAVMRAHLAEGNRCEALRQYELFRRLLAEELGVGPSPEMEMLHHRCVRGDAVVTPLR
jgi:DNA-binding SARP family transcriptional activator